jgi:DNA polymerase-3 subunit epsilon
MISETTFTVVDLETTGGLQETNRIIDLCAIKVKNGKVFDRYATLINPQIPISFFITQYTGISNEMVSSAPLFESIQNDLYKFLDGSVFVAHNVTFDLGFLNMEFERCGNEKLNNRWLCTYRLAKRLLPQQKKVNLGDLSNYFGITIKDRHRANGDTEATVGILQHLIEIAGEKHGIDRLDELISLQFKPFRHFKKEPQHVQHLREQVVGLLPKKPGVYLMKSQSNEILYIGKSKNLKARVSSYFNHTEHSDKVKELIGRVKKLDHIVTGSELEALLLESRLIKQHKPAFNTLLKHYRTYPFIILTEHEYPKLEISTNGFSESTEAFGPFNSMELARKVLDILQKEFKLRKCSTREFSRSRTCLYLEMQSCIGPCHAEDETIKTTYAFELSQLKQFLSGHDPVLIKHLKAKMKGLAEIRHYEEAAELRKKIKSLSKIFYRQASITASANQNNALILLPSQDFSEDNPMFCVLLVRYGRLMHQKTVLASEISDLKPFLEDTYFNGHPRPDHIQKDELDEMMVLANWIYHKRHSLQCLYIKEAESLKKVLKNLDKRIGKLSEKLCGEPV